jgi:hypothetical protein
MDTKQDKAQAAFERVYRTPIGELTRMTFEELQELQAQILGESRRAKLARRWLQGAIEKKLQDEHRATVTEA